MSNDIRTHAIILRRTNYGETDRILNVLTSQGKISVLAKGARKEKSRLAGGIELFSVADIVVHHGRGKLGTLTSAQMLRFYGNILTDLSRLELASEILRRTERISEQIDNPDYFDIVDQSLSGLHQRMPLELVKAWFILNLAQASGEEINLLTDVDGEDLHPDAKYHWDGVDGALRIDNYGSIASSEIKLARLLLQKPLLAIAHIQQINNLIMALEPIVRSFM